MRDVTIALCVIATAALLSLLLRGILAPTNLAMIFLLGVIVIAVQCSRATAVVASFLSVAVFDFLFVPPYWTFVVEDSEYIVTFVGMLAVALIISGQTALLKQQRTDSEIGRAHV